MWRTALFYAPPVLMLCVAAGVTPSSRRGWDARQLLLTIAFIWMMLAISWRVTRSTKNTTPGEATTNEIQQSNPDNEPTSTVPVPLDYCSPDVSSSDETDNTSLASALIVLGVVICGIGLAILLAASGRKDPDLTRSIVILAIGGGLCAMGMAVKRPQR